MDSVLHHFQIRPASDGGSVVHTIHLAAFQTLAPIHLLCPAASLHCRASGGPQATCHIFDGVAVRGLKLSFYIGETIFITIYTHYGNPKP